MPHKLLLADDSLTIQRVVELTFSGEDVDVVAVGDGDEAIARIPAERPDIVLADIGMPKRSGYEVSAFVKGNPDLKRIPVLLLAGAFEPVDEARAKDAGCDGVLVKPFEPQQVIARVRELLEGRTGTAPHLDRAPSPPAAPAPALRAVDRSPAPKPLEFPRRDDTRTAPPQPAPPPLAAEPEISPFAPEPSSVLDDPPSLQGIGSAESLGDYFDRLDAAFATLEAGTRVPPQPSAGPSDDRLDVPTVDDVVGRQEIVPGRGAAADRGASGASLLADAFSAFLAVEEGTPGARPVRLATVGQLPEISEALVDEITRRVLEKLAPGAIRETVAKLASEMAEQLVREEIERGRSRS